MKRKWLGMMLGLVVFCFPMSAEVVAILPELSRPAALTSDGERLYIMDEACVFVYRISPFRKLMSLGARGEGPGEFASVPFLNVLADGLSVQTLGKIQTFSLQGEFLREIKMPFVYFYMYFPLLPVGKHHVGFPLQVQDSNPRFLHVGRVYDADFKVVKEFYRGGPPLAPPPPRRDGKIVKTEKELIPDCLGVGTAEGRIFVGDTRKGFHIEVFNERGESLFRIDKQDPRLKVPRDVKDSIWDELKQSPDWELYRQMYDFKMRDVYPAFSTFKVHGDRIYLTTFARRDRKYQLIVMDLQGNIQSESFTFPYDPRERILSGSFIPYHLQYTVCRNSLYYLQLDEEQGVYTLHARNIGP